jgi:hypothetical protein
MGRVVSDDRGVANLGHHACHHVVQVVAVKRPTAGIVGVEGDGNAAHRRHQDGVAHGTCELGTVYASHPVAARSRARKPGRPWRAAETAAQFRHRRRLRSAVGRQSKPPRLAIEYRLYFTLPHLNTAAVPTLGSTRCRRHACQPFHGGIMAMMAEGHPHRPQDHRHFRGPDAG